MRFEAFVLGGYPRTPRARHALRDGEKGKLGSWELTSLLSEENLLAIGAQIGAGLKLIADPVIEWHDIFRPFAESWRGVYVDGLLRYFDNNFFYRIPVFVDKPDPQRPVLTLRARSLIPRLPRGYNLKIQIPGPVTFARLSRNESGAGLEDLAEEIARILSRDAARAVEAGVAAVQVDEPWLSDVDATREDAELAKNLFNEYFSELPCDIFFAVYFNAPRIEVAEGLKGLEADLFIVDAVDNPQRALEIIERLKPEGIGVGAIQARNIYRDDYEFIRRILEKVATENKPERLALTTSTWLDLIPYNYAFEKTTLLGEYARRLAGDLGIKA